MKKKSAFAKPRISALNVASIIEAMAMGECSPALWDSFVGAPISHPELEGLRQRCLLLPLEFPPESAEHYCGPQGRQLMYLMHDFLCRFPGARTKGAFEALTGKIASM